MAVARSSIRIAVNVALDGLAAALAVPVASWLADPAAPGLAPYWRIPAGAACLLLAGVPFRLSQQYWRFAAIGDLLTVAASAGIGAALFWLITLGAGVPFPNPAFPAIHALTLLLFLGAPRVLYRWGRWRPDPQQRAVEAASILLVGSIEDADLFLRALAQDRRPQDRRPAFRVEGLLVSSNRQTGRRIQGRAILGSLDDAATVLEQLRADDRLPGMLVVVTPELARLAEVVAQADRFGLIVRQAPRPTALADPDKPRPVELRPVAIEDLLNRPQVPLDRDGMARLIQGRRVIVTGAGGTIGSELARQVAAFGPGTLILLDNGEYALWQIDLELAETHPSVPRKALIADIRDEARIHAIFQEHRPELVFHAAALKHVPMVEANPLEGLATNAAGTRHVADAARAVGTLAMVLISTDKAVNPTSVMGASKRLAEMYCQALDIVAQSQQQGMRCITVRFGNVLGSTGSVVPLFQRQLARGGPLTVTHPDMQRYFMTVREAVGLVLQASVLGLSGAALPSGATGGIFVLDMGEPVKIVHLARQIIRLAGLQPDKDIEIRFTGLRPGEKLFEELFHGKEPPVPTGYAGLLMASPRTADPAIVARAIEEIGSACRGGQVKLALTLLGRLIPEFEHNADGTVGEVRA
ncbi:polysaccharide biosynthesis protein [Rhodopila sp.]|uniref:polysaccharide biosynthesis protein n=1 Tax=Rhodopila sp. TaxID=2480087 RepID=UPI002C979346|nr:nucleoside-diphosphate sugar epimerase/dehydratase [Rhodopila sp.]HVZ08470.1 nucleoside-diphosphate sugar epimerase/dehydratase [Rhodopila sp.]